jgi:hypothetical protein
MKLYQIIVKAFMAGLNGSLEMAYHSPFVSQNWQENIQI